VAIPAERLSEDFFQLNGKAGCFIEKFARYRLRLAILGDISAQVEAHEALANFVREANQGAAVWFVRDSHELSARLASGE
jgi:hypothetical protein